MKTARIVIALVLVLCMVFAVAACTTTPGEGDKENTTTTTAKPDDTPSTGDDTPGDDTPGDDTPGDDTPGDDTPGDDAPGDDAPEVEIPETAANITDGLTLYAIERPSEFSENPESVIYNISNADYRNLVNGALGAIGADRTAEGKAVVRIENELFEVEHYANGGDWYRLNVAEKGAKFLQGVVYNFTLYVYNADGEMVAYTDTIAHAAELSNTEDTRTGANVDFDVSTLTKASVDASTLTKEGINVWNDERENVAQLFDGDTVNSKIGGGTVGGQVTIGFALDAARTVTHYVLYTGNDTADSPNRNPAGWTLYGSTDGETFVELDAVASTAASVTGLGATNATPYVYAVSSTGEYQFYKIVFTVGGAFQMNELELYY